MNREGVETAGDLAVVGDERTVREQLRAYREAGATDIVLMPIGADATDLRRLWAVAAAL